MEQPVKSLLQQAEEYDVKDDKKKVALEYYWKIFMHAQSSKDLRLQSICKLSNYYRVKGDNSLACIFAKLGLSIEPSYIPLMEDLSISGFYTS